MKNLIPKNSPKSLSIFLRALLIVGGVGVVFSLYSFISGVYSASHRSFCFESGCLINFVETQKETVLILNGTFSVLVSISTVGAIIVALMTYINTMKTSALTNHISHLKTFQDYVLNEVDKLPAVTKSSINTLVWYNYIYEKSRDGDIFISESYKEKIKSFNDEINTSNSYYSDAKQPSFSYLEHQTTFIELFAKVGITASRDTRSSFFESEEQLFSLLDNVNKEFCGVASLVLTKRLYK